MAVNIREALKELELELEALAELRAGRNLRDLCNSVPLSICRTLLKLYH